MPRKHTYEFVKKTFEDSGCELLETEYKRSSDKLRYICGDCGNETTTRFSNFKRGCKCKNCRTKETANARRLSYVEVQKTFEDQGCKLLSAVYVNSMEPLEYECVCGKKSKILLGNFKKGSRCMECGINKLRGVNNHQWNPNKSEDSRNTPEYRAWRKAVLERDEYYCQKCGEMHWAMTAHHVRNFGDAKELRYDVENGISLCRMCHGEFHSMYGFTDNDGKQLLIYLSETDNDPWFAGEPDERY